MAITLMAVASIEVAVILSVPGLFLLFLLGLGLKVLLPKVLLGGVVLPAAVAFRFGFFFWVVLKGEGLGFLMGLQDHGHAILQGIGNAGGDGSGHLGCIGIHLLDVFDVLGLGIVAPDV